MNPPALSPFFRFSAALRGTRGIILLLLAIFALLVPAPVRAQITVGPDNPNGDGGDDEIITGADGKGLILPHLIPPTRFFSPPGPFATVPETVPLKNGGVPINIRPCGVPATVQIGGYTVFFLPKFVNTAPGGFTTAAVRAYASHPVPGAAFAANIVNFPTAGSETLINLANEKESAAATDYPALVAAATFQGKIWIAVGGQFGGKFYQPKTSIFDVYVYQPNPADPAYPLNGTYTSVGRITVNDEVHSIAAASMSNLDQVPTTGLAQPVLAFFTAGSWTNAQSVRAFTTSNALTLPTLAAVQPNIKLGAGLSAVTTVDSIGKPVIALAWSVTTSYSVKQYGLGISFFDGHNFVADAPTLLGSQGVPIPQAVTVATGTVVGNTTPGNRLQVFGTLNNQVARWEYEITGSNGAGRWTNANVNKPYGLDVKSMGLNSNYPDAITSVAIPVSIPGSAQHPEPYGGTPLPYFQNTLVVMTWNPIFDAKGFVKNGQLNFNSYDSDQLIPYGVHAREHPKLEPWVRSQPLSMDDPIYSDAWTLIGVFHGVPPCLIPVSGGFFTGNGGSISYSKEVTGEANLTSSYSVAFGAGYGGKSILGALDLEIGFKSEVTKTFSTTTSWKMVLNNSHSTQGDPPNAGYMLFQIPTLQATLFRRSNTGGVPIPLSPGVFSDLYVGTVTGSSIELKAYNLTNPNANLIDSGGTAATAMYSSGMAAKPATNDLPGWTANVVDPHGTVSYGPPDNAFGFNPFAVRAGSSPQSTSLAWGSDTTNRQDTTISVNAKATLFGVTASVGSSATTSVSMRYTTTSTITAGLAYPAKIGTVAQINVAPYFFTARDQAHVSTCDFVPTKYKPETFLPFLVTYHVDYSAQVEQGPMVATDLVGQTATVGQSVQFNVAGAGNGPISYQWYFNGEALSGQTGPTLSLANVTSAQAGAYYVTLTDSDGVTQSSSVPLTILGAPIFAGAMTSGSVAPDQDLTFQSTAVGAAGLTYQWSVNGTVVPGVTGNSYTLPAAQISPDGTTVSVQVTNAFGTASDSTVVTADPNAPRNPGADLFAGSAVSPSNFWDIPFQGNVYNVVLMQGQSVTAQAVAGQITRIPFLDPEGDICFVEFSGAGTVTVSMPDAALTTASNYNQPGVTYTQGSADVLVSGGDATTYISIYSLGTDPTRIAPSMLKPGANLAGIADIHSLSFDNSTVAMGGINASNARFTGAAGNIGILAPNVGTAGYVYIGNILASDGATPNLLFAPDAAIQIIASGSLGQPNGRAIMTSGVAHVGFAGSTSSTGLLSGAPQNQAVFFSDSDITAAVTQ